jgi:hypothetical protein
MASLSTSPADRATLEMLLMDHIRKQLEVRQQYYKTRSKVIESGNKSNLSMMVDAAGSTGLTFSPRACRVSKNMEARHDMMKIKSTFTKMHGYGIRIDINFPNLEKMGTNLAIDCILENILHYMKANDLKQLDNVYIQLDNVNSNKGLLLFGVLAALIIAGVIKKCKISYLIVGHTHDDIDGVIGDAATSLRGEDVYSLSELE